MIVIAGRPAELQNLALQYPQGSMAWGILSAMQSSRKKFEYDSPDALRYELRLREATVGAARNLYRSGMDFAVFRKSRCNRNYWERTPEGGFVLREGVRPSEAIRDIYKNGRQYATECATAILIVFYGAVLSLSSDEAFDRAFPDIELMNWHRVSPPFRSIGQMSTAEVLLPGDRSYFANPDVNPMTPEWQGENVIVLGDGSFYGHGIGIKNEAGIVNELNANRTEGAGESAYLMRRAGRPDYGKLAGLTQPGG